MTGQVKYEPVNPMANKQPFVQYLSATPTRIFRIYGPRFSHPFLKPYIDSPRILTDRISKFNAKYIRDKSNLRLASVFKLTLKMVKNANLEKRKWKPLPEFLSKKEAIINLQNHDERCFGDALLYIVESANLQKSNCFLAHPYTDKMLQRHQLDTLDYPILLNEVHLYENQFQININVFCFLMTKSGLAIPW